ncbi:MAG: succinate dehydrogenase, cytochrome b556 subunit [Arenimonas sp.]
MAARQRPLSPHLDIYKKQITSVLSITHRMTGVVLAIGALAVTAWLLCVGGNDHCYAWCQKILASWFGQLALFVFSACMIYHLLNGIRHLLWDIGWGMDIATVEKTGYLVVVLSVILTGLLWFVALRGGVL